MSLGTSHTIDALIRKAVFDQGDSQSNARQTLYSLAKYHHIELSSTHFLYKAFAQRKLPLFSVPAINIRTLTYENQVTYSNAGGLPQGYFHNAAG